MDKNQKVATLKDPRVFFLSLFGLGKLPRVPGTWGSLFSLVMLFFLLPLPFFSLPIWIGANVVSFGLGYLWTRQTETLYGLHDPSWIVWDEWMGMLLGWISLWGISGPQSYLFAFLYFVCFRFFDIIKIGPVGYIDKNWKGPMGTLCDDLAAAVLAGLVVRGLYWLAPGLGLTIY